MTWGGLPQAFRIDSVIPGNPITLHYGQRVFAESDAMLSTCRGLRKGSPLAPIQALQHTRYNSLHDIASAFRDMS